jgi:putative heme-binding domain-containing protein
LFFDATRLDSCHACHNYAGAGGPIGPDLAKLGRPAIQVLGAISQPRVPSTSYPAIELTLRDGTRLQGIERDESGEAIRLYDISSVPPVSRRFRKSEVLATRRSGDTGIYDHTALHYSRQDLLDLSAFLGH